MFKITPIHYKRLIKVFNQLGFHVTRTEGDHVVMIKEGNLRPLVIPKWKSVPVFIIKNNLRSAGLTREEYFKLLERI